MGHRLVFSMVFLNSFCQYLKWMPPGLLFKGSNQQSCSFAHDALGRMIHNGMTGQQIAYNDLDLVRNIEASGATLVNYSYLADGTKFSSTALWLWKVRGSAEEDLPGRVCWCTLQTTSVVSDISKKIIQSEQQALKNVDKKQVCFEAFAEITYFIINENDE